ncbi:MAG: hypothetical protein LLG04_14190 [Parachlamydia sp.]|nr:hypothetical protein [Parachlamydia sp.]
MQVALLGAITNNLRAVNVENDGANINVIFYYATPPSEDEEELSEIIVSEMYADYGNIPNIFIEARRVVLPLPNRIPEVGLRVFHRSETQF